MGKIFTGKDIWNHPERRHPIRPRRPERIVKDREYLGFGHWIVEYNDGTKELRWVPTPECRAFFYGVGEWDNDGFPVLESHK